MTARARVEFDPMRGGVRIAVSPRMGEVILWPDLIVTTVEAETVPGDARSFLPLDEDVARAVYEELARYFGGVGADLTSLRRDYDAERKRVDVFIAHLTGRTS